MSGHECYHCKQWVKEGEPHDCWTTTEAALTADLSEDLRDAWGPARVLHHATELAGIAPTGPIPPFVSALAPKQVQDLAPVARQLRELDA